jgi:hypothetical protein
MNRKQKFWLIVVVAYTLITTYFAYPLFIEFPSECGTVIDKKQPDAVNLGRNSGRLYVDNILVVNYNGKIQSVSVDDNTFYSYNKGQIVCFDRSYYNYHPTKATIGSILLFIYGIAAVFIIIFGIADLYTTFINNK